MDDGTAAPAPASDPAPMAEATPSVPLWANPATAAGLVALAGMMHLVLVGQHMSHALGSGLFFLTLGGAQVAWALFYVRNPSDDLRRLGLATMAAAPTALYVVTRTLRVPWSPEPEHIDALGVITQIFQVAAVVLLMPRGRPWLRVDGGAAIGVGILLALGGYTAGLAAEDVDVLGQPRTLHGHDGEEHATHEGHGLNGTLIRGERGVSMVGTTPYYGPPTGTGIGEHCRAVSYPDDGCWLYYLTGVLVANGSVEAFAVLEQLIAAEPQADALGHTLAHGLGHNAYQVYGLDVKLALQECSYEVFQGCLHGVIQAHFADLAAQGLGLDRASLSAVCSGARNSFESYTCMHGLGHGIMVFTNADVPRSLDLCFLLPGEVAKGDCYGGVYMENIVGYFASLDPNHVGHAHGDEPPEYWIDPEEPAYPCNVVDKRYKPSCWRMQTSVVLHYNGGDFQAASEVCSNAKPFNLDCFSSLGRDAVPYSNRQPLGMSAGCSFGTTEEQTACVRSFTIGVILHFNDAGEGLKVCEQVPSYHKQACYYATGLQSSRMVPAAETASLCDRAESAYAEFCHDGAKR